MLLIRFLFDLPYFYLFIFARPVFFSSYFHSSPDDSQAILTEESKSAYNILIEKPVHDTTASNQQHLPAVPTPPSEPEDSNPLRMLRSGGLTVVRPKIRGNKHQSQSSRDSRELKVIHFLMHPDKYQFSPIFLP